MSRPEASTLTPEALQQKHLPYQRLHADVLAAFLENPDALHGRALSMVEQMQSYAVDPRTTLKRDAFCDTLREWKQAPSLPEQVARVRDLAATIADGAVGRVAYIPE